MFENAKWIRSEKDYDRTPITYCRRIELKGKVKSAVMNVTAGGVYEVYIDGMKVGKNVLAPGFTVFPKHHLYKEYDITDMLRAGSNLTVSVASGWYAGAIARNHFPADINFALIAQIDIVYEDGSKETIVTDEDGKWTCGRDKYISSDIYLGEVYDARITPVLNESVIAIDYGKTQLCPQDGEDIVEHDVFAPIATIKTPAGETVIDFGCNISGYPFFRNLSAAEGEVVSLSFAEVLDKDGNFYIENYRIRCDFIYICKNGVQSYKPHHTFYGFRYVRVNKFPKGTEPADVLRATDVFSDIERNGTFECGIELVNKLFANVIRGQKGNFLDVPTDCPQRDERLGWTGDAQVF